jgi:hypothetical protein
LVEKIKSYSKLVKRSTELLLPPLFNHAWKEQRCIVIDDVDTSISLKLPTFLGNHHMQHNFHLPRHDPYCVEQV